MTAVLRIVHLFPELLNLYADQGNIAVLRGRALGRGIGAQVQKAKVGEAVDFAAADLVLLGGGSDREQAVVGRELLRYRDDLRAAVEDGLPLLAVCGGYQLLGHYYALPGGERVPGLSVVDLVTESGKGRLIGNIAIELTERSFSGSPVAAQARTVVGFENHGGRTRHTHAPLGRVLAGHGNNGEDGREGLLYRNLIGTYIRGPLLPKNPHIADWLLSRALARRGLSADLAELDDSLEWQAHRAALALAGAGRKF